MTRPKALLSWSSGKDCAWTLHVLRRQNEIDVVGLVTTFNEAFNRVAMHGVRMDLVQAQAAAVGLPLWSIPLPWPCSNEIYELRIGAMFHQALDSGISRFAFGDLFLEDVRAYRERQLAGTGIEPVFPLWGTPADTPALARQMIDAGMSAILTCVDPKQLEKRYAGRQFDRLLLDELPLTVDPCGERGEFHTFCHAGPMFDHSIAINPGEVVERDGFWFADITSQRTNVRLNAEPPAPLAAG